MKPVTVIILVAAGFALNLCLVAFSQESTSSTWPPGELHCDPQDDLDHPFQCPSHEDGRPTYFPYPYNCRKFYECSNGNATCVACAPGTVWNQTLQTCDHEAWTDCIIVTTGQPPITTPAPTTETEQPTTETEQPTTETEQPTTEEPGNEVCPPNYSGPIADPWNCDQYYICIPGEEPCLQPCPDELVYDPQIEQCVSADDYPCEQTPIPRNYRTERRFSDILHQGCLEPTEPPQV